jgi:hypothetical protein
VSAVVAVVVQQLARIAEPWRSAYSESVAISTAVLFTHLAALVVGAGLALAADRATLRSWTAPPRERSRHLAELAITHRPVVAALSVLFVSGGLLFLADVENYATSAVFWTKMGLVALLLGNGFAMTRAERALRSAGIEPNDADLIWRRLRGLAMASVALWMATLLAGTVLASK